MSVIALIISFFLSFDGILLLLHKKLSFNELNISALAIYDNKEDNDVSR